MQKLGFGEKWMRWIKSFFTSIRISILINGSSTEEFSPSNGFRQRDPLSPLLFNLTGEVLSKMLVKARLLQLIKGIKLSATSKELTHSQYSDDTILFIKNDLESVCKLKEVLQCLQLLSGLKINFNKSKIYSYSKFESD